MKIVTSLLFFLLLLIIAVKTAAQTVLQNNPPSVSWYQVRTPHFNVLFPEGFEDQAKRMANHLEHIYLPETHTLTSKPPRISVVLQNRSSESNGFVSLTPRRSEFYTMPPQDYNFIGNNDWLNLVSTHEFRHVIQYEHAKQGVNRFIYYLTGNFGLASMAGFAVPSWFWEGDAVVAETVFTPTGRGRIPNFGLVFRTNMLEGRSFNYHKQLLRSYKHQIPNEYVLGYHMVSYLRKRTGDPLIWDKITTRAWRSSIVPFTFSNAIKKETGLHVTDLYKEMAADLKKDWQQEVESVPLTAYTKINIRRSEAYTDYLYPQVTDRGIVAMKTGIGDIHQLVFLDGGDERKVYVPGIVNETGMISAAGSRIVWNEYRFDPRWRVETYSAIVAYDLQTKKKWTVSPKRSRYAGAALSPDGKQIVTVESDEAYRHSLVILNVTDGSIVKKFTNPENFFYSMPRWSDDGSKIVVLKTTEQGKSVATVQVDDGTATDIIPPSNENIGYPVLHGSWLLYNSPLNGIDNIYAYDLESKKKYQITNSHYGAYNPVISTSGRSIFYNEQSRDGMDVARIAFQPDLWKEITGDIRRESQLYEVVTEQEESSHVSENVPTNDYPITKYSKLKGMFNPYTWGPYFDNSLNFAEIGITSQDILSTTAINAGYQYDIYENTGAFHAGISYQGFYPILNFAVSYGDRKESKSLTSSRDVEFEWKENNFSAGVLVPLLLTKSKYHTELSVSNNIGFTLTSSFNSSVFNPTNGEKIDDGGDRFVSINDADTLFYLYRDITDFGQLIYNHFSVSYSRIFKQSRRDFNPKFAQVVLFDHLSTPYGDYQGWQWTARGFLYLPGAFKHHSVVLRGGYQESLETFELDAYQFRNYLLKPRGYSFPNQSKFTYLSANYELPLWYPDISLGPIVNIQRVKANAFFDYGKGEGFNYFHNFGERYIIGVPTDATYKSFGGELTVDLNFFRLVPQFELGVRASWITANEYSNSGWVYEFLIGNIPL